METKSSLSKVSAYAFLGIGFEFIFVFFAFTGAGWLHDLYAPWASGKGGGGILAGIFLGLFGALWHLYRRTQGLQSAQVEKEAFSQKSNTVSVSSTQSSSPEELEKLSQDIEDLHKKLGEKLGKP